MTAPPVRPDSRSMRTRVTVFALALLLAVAVSPAGAQNREHQQLTADIRMLEEQLSRVLLANNQLAEQLKATNKRLDDILDSNVKQFANQKVLIDQAVATLGNVREKLQDGDLRVQQLTQEMTPIRDGHPEADVTRQHARRLPTAALDWRLARCRGSVEFDAAGSLRSAGARYDWTVGRPYLRPGLQRLPGGPVQRGHRRFSGGHPDLSRRAGCGGGPV